MTDENRQRAHKIAQATQGRTDARAAYKFGIFYDLDQGTPRHGARPFECVHVYHAEISHELRQFCGIIGKHWLTVLIDAFTRRILAFCVASDPPGYRTCMTVLRKCVRIYGRLPQLLIVEGSENLRSDEFEVFLTRNKITMLKRTRAVARSGSFWERLFGQTSAQLFARLGEDVRLFAKLDRAPVSLRTAIAVLAKYFFEYDRRVHPALGMSPQAAFNEGLLGVRKTTGGIKKEKK